MSIALNPLSTVPHVGRLLRWSLALGAGIGIVTELLGAFSLLSLLPVLVVWALTAIGLVRWGIHCEPPLARGRWQEVVSRTPRVWWVVACFLLATFITGFLGAPNTWDGLTYHLPRVERWVEQEHLQFWPTSVDRQLWMAPWSGYAILHLRLLTGGDRLAFLPSWLAYLGCILLTARLVRQLGGDVRRASVGALLMAAMPVAVLHASSVQTDLPAAFWVMCVATLAIGAWHAREVALDWRHAAWLGVAAALAMATKGTVLMAILPWLLVYARALGRAGGARALVRPFLLGALAVLLLNGAQFSRNIDLFGSPLGDPTTRSFLQVSPLTPPTAVANLLANVSLHLGTPIPGWNGFWSTQIHRVFTHVLSLDVAATFQNFGQYRVMPFSVHESEAGNPMHLLLLLMLPGLVLLVGRVASRGATVLLVGGLTALVLHATLIQWQPFGARLQLGALIWIPAGAALLMQRPWLRLGLITATVCAALPALLQNALRPLIPRGERGVLTIPRQAQYFAQRPALRPSLDSVAGRLQHAGCTELGLGAGYDTPEYLVRVANRVHQDHVRLHYFEPASPSARLAVPTASDGVCALLVITPPPGWQVPAPRSGMSIAYVDEHVALFLRRPNEGTGIVPRP